MPSYLSSTQTGVPSRLSTSASSATGEASIDLSGRKRTSSASPRRSSRASAAVWPRSPVSMPVHCTSASWRSKALAIAASRWPSRRPMRSSPLSTLITERAVSGSQRSSSARSGTAFAAAPRAAAISANAASTSGSVGGSPDGHVIVLGEQVAHRLAEVGGLVVGSAERSRTRRPRSPRRRRRSTPSRCPSCAGRAPGTAGRSCT